MKVWQEFFCATSGGGCGGFVMVKLNMGINHNVDVICPKCSHRHRRRIENGTLLEKGRHSSDPVEEICPPISAWSETPQTVKNLSNVDPKDRRCWQNERDAAVISSQQDLIRDSHMWERWQERFGGGYDLAQE